MDYAQDARFVCPEVVIPFSCRSFVLRSLAKPTR